MCYLASLKASKELWHMRELQVTETGLPGLGQAPEHCISTTRGLLMVSGISGTDKYHIQSSLS